MRIFTDLLFLHGHIANVELARELAGANAAQPEAAPSNREERKAMEQAPHHPRASTTQSETPLKATACINH
ncbi:hypothetical protein [Stenotrophomonas sp. Iso1]|uniref:hypothetical protein n=1 Tax=Stenotrophomonas sp. Iso1 TaxID=2977283 RepID=UPI0022B7C86F|nr:hypothetical protein [Stenotrophomonas sp. Iso1]